VRPQRFDQAKPFLTLAVVALAWLFLPVVVKRFLRASFFELQAPVAVVASGARDLQEFWALKTRSNNELIAAGRDLAGVLASYELSVSQKAELEAENTRLRALLGLPEEPGWRYERARVVLRDFSGWWQQLTIRKGRDSGIPVGAPVVFSGGVVGRVSSVGLYTSVVDLVSSPGLRIAAVIEGDTRPISYQGGDNPTFGPARGVADYVPVDVTATTEAPRRLFTSGLGGVFPAKLPIGRLVRVEPAPDGLFKTGEVQLDPALSNLTEVTVLVSLAPVASNPPTPATP
jgi:rod shape-determining protein MreC